MEKRKKLAAKLGHPLSTQNCVLEKRVSNSRKKNDIHASIRGGGYSIENSRSGGVSNDVISTITTHPS